LPLDKGKGKGFLKRGLRPLLDTPMMNNLIANSVLLQRRGGTGYAMEALPLFNSPLLSPPFDSLLRQRGERF
ncbi:MAG: hypothetical protein D4S01_08155, partial [Dehalococcoidia bacterium]